MEPSCNPIHLGCNSTCPKLQPYASQAATLCISGELDDSRLVDAAAGERFVFKRRGTETEAPRGDQESYLVITPRRRHGGGSRRGLTRRVPTVCLPRTYYGGRRRRSRGRGTACYLVITPLQEKPRPRRLTFVMDVSGSMYRFNGHDGRLNKMLETTCLVMEVRHVT